MANTIRCYRCGKEKNPDSFHRHKNRKSGRASACKQCCKELSAARYPLVREKQIRGARAWNARHPERYLAFQLKHYFGLTLEQYKELEAAHEGRCAICDKKPTRRLDVDHSHDTGHVRGLLCNSCNRGLGMFGHNPVHLRAAALYLEIHENSHPEANPSA